MIGAIGMGAWQAVRCAARAIRVAHNEQVYMWECMWRSSTVAPPTATGPLCWVPSLDGYRLDGSHLAGPDRGRNGAVKPGPADPRWSIGGSTGHRHWEKTFRTPRLAARRSGRVRCGIG
jgi:hypothetical protein